jgi:hypothetical protein
MMAATLRRLEITLAAVTIVVAGCSGDSDGGGTTSSGSQAGATTTAPAPQAQSAWEVAVAGIADGVVPVEVALEAFAVAFGPLPGVASPPGRLASVTSGTGALRWIRANWEALTPEQQGMVSAYENPAGLASAGLSLAGGGVDSVALLGLAEQMKLQIEAHLGRTLTAEIEVVIAPEAIETDNPGAWAWASPIGTGGPWSGDLTLCRITIGKLGIPTAEEVDALGVASPALASLMAHEVFHCFDFDLGSIEASVVRPPWVAEGLAEWVGLTLGVGESTPPEIGAIHWSGWFDLPEVSLFDREYSAVGFYSHLDDTGTEVWSAIDPVLSASDQGNLPAYNAATPVVTPVFLDTWASSLVRDFSRAPDWDSSGPGLTATARSIPRPEEPIGNGSTLTRGAPAFAATLSATDLQAEVVVLGGPGPGMVLLPDGASLPRAEVNGRPLCTLEGGCTCPEGTPGASAIFRLVPPGEMVLAITGGPADNAVTVEGLSLEDFCQRSTCPVGSWTSIRWEVPGIVVTGGVGTLSLTIDSDGTAVATYDPEAPVFGTLQQEGAVTVKMVFSGGYTMTFTPDFSSGQLTGGAASMTSYADLGGEWVQTAPPIDLLEGGIGAVAGSTFECVGEELRAVSPVLEGSGLVFGRAG